MQCATNMKTNNLYLLKIIAENSIHLPTTSWDLMGFQKQTHSFTNMLNWKGKEKQIRKNGNSKRKEVTSLAGFIYRLQTISWGLQNFYIIKSWNGFIGIHTVKFDSEICSQPKGLISWQKHVIISILVSSQKWNT